MTANTIEINQSRQALHEYDEIWLFGYGSLIYKVDFPYLEKSPAYILGWQRRFWQGSHDHRGTPDNPGRVVTLIAQENCRCDGMAYRVTAEEFIHLDHREKNGYLRHEVPLALVNEAGQIIQKRGLIYIADENNSAYLGEDSEKAIAEHIANCCGPSGENSEYLILLDEALNELGVKDEHISKIRSHLNL
ncbi:MAG: cation transport protein ChaC [Oceanicoccus sp.]|jgi:cation transport protein ChaC